MRSLACDACGAGFVGAAGLRCPACGQGEVGEGADLPVGEPERQLPDTHGRSGAMAALQGAIGGVRYRTSELHAEVLGERLERSWWPRWLVDAQVVGRFSARAGSDYQVQSSREVLKGGRWVTEPHLDTRIRWEERVGRVDVEVHDVPVDALRDHGRWASRLGALGAGASEPWSSPEGLVRLPDRGPEEVRPDVVAAFRKAAARHVHQALGCDHLDDFVLTGGLDDGTAALHHTWLLHPVYTTWYRDDAGEVHMLWVNGSSGKVWGPMWASPRKGGLWALLWLLLGLSLLAGSAVVGLIGVVLWPLLVVAAIGGCVGLLLLALAVWPVLAVWRHNRLQAALD